MDPKITPGRSDPASSPIPSQTKKEVSTGGHKITIGTHRPEPKKADIVERKVFPPLPKIPGEETAPVKEHHVSKESPDKSDKVTRDTLRGTEGRASPKIAEKEAPPQNKIQPRQRAPLIPESVQKPLVATREQKIASVLTEAINKGDIQTVRKIGTLAVGNDLAPVVTICLHSPNKDNVEFLLVLKQVLILGKQDTTKVNQAIDQAITQGFKKAIETNDASLIRDLFSKAEKGKCDTQKLWENATTTLKNPVDAAFAQRIKDKFEGLQASAAKGEHNLNPFQMLKICVVAEFKLQAGGPENQAVYLKKTDEGLGASLLIDHKQKTYTILSKESIAEGGAGKVKKAIEVAEKTLNGVEAVSVAAVIRKVNLDGVEMSPQEIEYEKKYGGLKSYATYTKGDAEKTTFTAKKYAGDIYALPKESSSSSRCNILQDSALKLATMHNDGVVHRDVKPGNILFAREDEEMRGNLIDYGMCFEPASSDETKSEVTGNPFFYGTPEYTSPEVLRNPDGHESLEDRKAQDAFAFGCTAYELLLNKECPWTSSITNRRKESAISGLEEARENLLKEIESGSLSPEQKTQYQIVHKLLDPNPATRMTIHQFLTEIAPHTSNPSAAIEMAPPTPKSPEKPKSLTLLDEVLSAATKDLGPVSRQQVKEIIVDHDLIHEESIALIRELESSSNQKSEKSSMKNKPTPTANDLDDFMKMMTGG